VLAGGRGERLGGDKATVNLCGRPLLHWPLDALRGALEHVAVVAKPDTVLPPLPPGVQRWDEPPQPRHPLTGIVEALGRAGDRAVLVCAADLPCVDVELIRRLALAEAGPGGVVIATAGRPQPLLGRYEPRAVGRLCAAPPDAALTATVLALDPVLLDVPAGALLNVNDEADLRRAERALSAHAAHGD
jgi:molybdopterin-guanine dinucleotide biosynthesis protein A